MSASDHLGIQFRQEQETTRAERKREREYAAAGADESERFGYSADDAPDYQYKRELTGKNTRSVTRKREVF